MQECQAGLSNLPQLSVFTYPISSGIAMALIPYSSSSSTTSSKYYHAFLSFRGEDTRLGFVAHLYKELQRKGLSCFKDDVELKNPEIVKAIEESRFAIVVVSQNYISSSWCLDELVKIIECKEKSGQSVLPVFYNVDPCEVRNQTGRIAEAFLEHEKEPNKLHKVKRWKTVLTKLGTIAGWNTRNRLETQIITEVVETILKELYCPSLDNLDHLVGIDSLVDQIKSLLHLESIDVRFFGIWGMGGIGKTTCVEVVYNQISSQFDSCCFLRNVRENSKKYTEVSLRGKMLSKILDDKDLDIETCSILPNIIKGRLYRKKVLIVLDDVSDIKQLDILVGEVDWFGHRSRIIMTSRDKQVLIQKANKSNIIEVKGLYYHQALQLFSLKAFKQSHPPEDYMELSKRVVDYVNGVPLALKVFGSLLYNKDKKEWESALERLDGYLNLDVHPTLRLSYDELSNLQKDIFLDIACFFKGKDRNWVENIMESYRFHVHFEISRLIDKCLIIEEEYGKLEMHDLLQEMGWSVVLQEPIDKRSRIWIPEDIGHVLTGNYLTGAIEGIFIDVAKVGKIDLNPSAFSRMYNLRFLAFYYHDFCTCYLGGFVSEPAGFISESVMLNGLQSLPNKLSCFYWKGYPWKSLPLNFSLENLVELHMHESKVEQLWHGVKHPRKLRILDLRHSNNLTILPDLSSAVKLEKIDLFECERLVKIPSFIGPHKNFIFLNLGYCKSLCTLPDLSYAVNLEEIRLYGCSSLVEIPSSIQSLQKLHSLYLSGCKKLRHLPSLLHLTSLWTLDLSYCPNLKKFPEIPENVQKLNLEETKFDECPPSIRLNTFDTLVFKLYFNVKKCPEISGNIKSLDFSGSTIEALPSSFKGLSSLVHLKLEGHDWLQSLPCYIGDLKCLEILDLSYCSAIKKLPSSIRGLTSLLRLNLEGCQKLESLPDTISDLKCLQTLTLSYCLAIRELPLSIEGLTSLVALNLKACKRLESFPSIESLRKLNYLNLSGCTELWTVPSLLNLISLRTLDLSCCPKLKKFPEIPKKIQYLYLHGSRFQECAPSIRLNCFTNFNFTLYFNVNKFPKISGNIKYLNLCGSEIEELPSSIKHLPLLVKLNLQGCRRLQTLPRTIGKLKCLTTLNLSYCISIKELPSSIGSLTLLVDLDLGGCQNLKSLPSTICYLKCLKILDLFDCSAIKELPSSIGGLTSLVSLDLERCVSLESLPSSICGLISLMDLNITDCGILSLPKGLGYLSSLRNLYMGGNNFERIPQSIKQLSLLQTLHLTDCERLLCLPELPCQIEQLLVDDCKSLEKISCSSIALVELPLPKEVLLPTFSFGNCFKLDQNARSNILAGAQLRIQHTPATLPGLPNMSKYLRTSFKVCLPGTEVPEWFSYQSMGCLIKSRLSPQGCCTKFNGLAVCAVVKFEGDYDCNSNDNSFYVKCKCHFKTLSGDDRSLDLVCPFEKCTTIFESEHLFLLYENIHTDDNVIKYDWLIKNYCEVSEASFQFTALNFIVKRCGAHLAYSQGEKVGNPTTVQLMSDNLHINQEGTTAESVDIHGRRNSNKQYSKVSKSRGGGKSGEWKQDLQSKTLKEFYSMLDSSSHALDWNDLDIKRPPLRVGATNPDFAEPVEEEAANINHHGPAPNWDDFFFNENKSTSGERLSEQEQEPINILQNMPDRSSHAQCWIEMLEFAAHLICNMHKLVSTLSIFMREWRREP